MKFAAGAVICVLLTLTSGCHSLVKSPAAPEQQIYAELMAAQSTLEGLKAQPDVAAKIKAQLNQAIASYNLAEKAFVTYEQNKLSNLTNPDDYARLQAAVAAFKVQLDTTVSAFKEEQKK